MAQLVDDRVRVVLLLGGRDARPLVEHQPLLPRASLVLLRFGDGCDELGRATRLDDLPGGLSLRVELPVARGALVGGVEDRPLEEAVVHGQNVCFAEAGVTIRLVGEFLDARRR